MLAIKNESIFLRAVCYVFILYNLQYFCSKWTQFKILNHNSDIYERIPRIILILTNYSTHPTGFVFSGIVVLFGILSSFLGLKLFEIGRKYLIVSLYITTFTIFVGLVSDTTMIYVIIKTYLRYPRDSNVTLSFTAIYLLYCLISVCSIIIVIWVIKQLRSQMIKNLFINKEALQI